MKNYKDITPENVGRDMMSPEAIIRENGFSIVGFSKASETNAMKLYEVRGKGQTADTVGEVIVTVAGRFTDKAPAYYLLMRNFFCLNAGMRVTTSSARGKGITISTEKLLYLESTPEGKELLFTGDLLDLEDTETRFKVFDMLMGVQGLSYENFKELSEKNYPLLNLGIYDFSTEIYSFYRPSLGDIIKGTGRGVRGTLDSGDINQTLFYRASLPATLSKLENDIKAINYISNDTRSKKARLFAYVNGVLRYLGIELELGGKNNRKITIPANETFLEDLRYNSTLFSIIPTALHGVEYPEREEGVVLKERPLAIPKLDTETLVSLKDLKKTIDTYLKENPTGVIGDISRNLTSTEVGALLVHKELFMGEGLSSQDLYSKFIQRLIETGALPSNTTALKAGRIIGRSIKNRSDRMVFKDILFEVYLPYFNLKEVEVPKAEKVEKNAEAITVVTRFPDKTPSYDLKTLFQRAFVHTGDDFFSVFKEENKGEEPLIIVKRNDGVITNEVFKGLFEDIVRSGIMPSDNIKAFTDGRGWLKPTVLQFTSRDVDDYSEFLFLLEKCYERTLLLSCVPSSEPIFKNESEKALPSKQLGVEGFIDVEVIREILLRNSKNPTQAAYEISLLLI